MSFSVLILMMLFISLGLLVMLLSAETFYKFIGLMLVILGVAILIGFRSQMLNEIDRHESTIVAKYDDSSYEVND